MKPTKTCKFCTAPIDVGFVSEITRADTLGFTAWFDKKECLSLLSISCVNCFHRVVSTPEKIVRRAPCVSELDFDKNNPPNENDLRAIARYKAEPIDRLYRCAAHYASQLLSAETAKRLSKRKLEEVTVHPPVDDQHSLLMLDLMMRVAEFRPLENRALTDSVSIFGTAVFWKASAYYRHLRKKFGIRGDICRFLTPVRHGHGLSARYSGFPSGQWNEKEQTYRENPFAAWRNVMDTLGSIETNLSTGAVDPIRDTVSANSGYYRCVWERRYEAAHYKSLTPIARRFKIWRFYVKKYNWNHA